MKSILCFSATILVLLPLLVINIDAYKERGILANKFANTKHLIEDGKLQSIQINYLNQSLKYLYGLTQQEKQVLLDIANQTLMEDVWHIGTATEYMQYFTEGIREIYELINDRYELRLCKLVLGHLLRKETNSTDTYFLNEIVDGLWTLLEQTSWIWPAHLYLEKGYKVLEYDHLPDPINKGIDLRTGEIAKRVATLQLFIRKDLEAVSPALNRRIDYELNKKIYFPYLNYQHEWKQGKDVSNHNSWTNGNIFRTALINLKNATLFNQIANDVYHSVDWLINRYGDDGGISEGPDYWRANTGRIIELIRNMFDLYPDAEEYFDNIELLNRMGEYALTYHIDKYWFVNFGDSIPQITYPPVLLQYFGDMYHNEAMKSFAMLMYRKPNNTEFVYALTDGRQLTDFFDLLAYKEYFDNAHPQPLVHQPKNYLESVQVMTARSNSSKNLFVGAKFANNYENHNHNDVGNFILFQNQMPMLIDVGTGYYNATTWSSKRYTYMYFRSAWHNVPTINGVEQYRDDKATSTNVSYSEKSDGSLVLRGNIAQTYPKQAMVKQWLRTMTFDPSKNIFEVNDQYELDKFVVAPELNFITHARARIESCDQGLMLHSDNDENMLMEFDQNVFKVIFDRWNIFESDDKLQKAWGLFIQRIRLVPRAKTGSLTGNFTVRFISQ